MTVDAIFQGGVFKPVGEVNLPENQKVRLNIEPWDRQDALARFEEARRLRGGKRGEFDSTPTLPRMNVMSDVLPATAAHLPESRHDATVAAVQRGPSAAAVVDTPARSR
jgi:predicted DNA-binding antitoxin AbrB/MazE fold protein